MPNKLNTPVQGKCPLVLLEDGRMTDTIVEFKYTKGRPRPQHPSYQLHPRYKWQEERKATQPQQLSQ